MIPLIRQIANDTRHACLGDNGCHHYAINNGGDYNFEFVTLRLSNGGSTPTDPRRDPEVCNSNESSNAADEEILLRISSFLRHTQREWN